MSGRERSFWGWGFEDALPDASARKGLANMASAMLGGAELKPREPPRVEDLELPAPRIDPPARIASMCSVGPRDRALHTYGRAYPDLVRGLQGDFQNAPDLVARPRSESDLRLILDVCADARIAAIPYGGGTSVVGGVEPSTCDGFRAVVSIDLGAMNRVVEVDATSRLARIQAGASGPALESQLSKSGLTLRHFPQSFELSTLGGWIATRAGGHFATLHTHIDDFVASIRAVTAGEVIETLRVPASGAGPSPDRLLLGSEGALGVITEAWMRVQPKPVYRASAEVAFTEWERAVTATREIAQAGLHPSGCRLLDAREAKLHQVRTDGSHVLLLAFESSDHPLRPWMERALAIAKGAGGALAGEPAYRDGEDDGGRGGAEKAWRKAFLDAPYLASALACAGVIVDTFETACTWDRFDALHGEVIRRVREAMKSACGGGIITSRFTHVYPEGPAPYYTFVAPARPGGEVEQWRAIKRAASEALLASGGTITHHHAVGRTHRPWYERQAPPAFADALRAVKRAWDPEGILNPGVLVDPAGSSRESSELSPGTSRPPRDSNG